MGIDYKSNLNKVNGIVCDFDFRVLIRKLETGYFSPEMLKRMPELYKVWELNAYWGINICVDKYVEDSEDKELNLNPALLVCKEINFNWEIIHVSS